MLIYLDNLVTHKKILLIKTLKKEYTLYEMCLFIEPDPPTNLQCPQNPLDVSLKISWTAPSEPNGNIVMYQINVSPRHLGQIYTSSNETNKNVEGLLPGITE